MDLVISNNPFYNGIKKGTRVVCMMDWYTITLAYRVIIIIPMVKLIKCFPYIIACCYNLNASLPTCCEPLNPMFAKEVMTKGSGGTGCLI
jgi:hypothetical protein